MGCISSTSSFVKKRKIHLGGLHNKESLNRTGWLPATGRGPSTARGSLIPNGAPPVLAVLRAPTHKAFKAHDSIAAAAVP